MSGTSSNEWPEDLRVREFTTVASETAVAMTTTHEHSPSHLPASGTGYAVCECGATARCELGRVVSDWHTCPLCVQRDGVPQSMYTEDVYYHYCAPEGRHKL